MLHLMTQPHAVFQVGAAELSPIAAEFVDRLALAPTVAAKMGTACAILASIPNDTECDSRFLAYCCDLEDATQEELRSLPTLHAVLDGLPQRQARHEVVLLSPVKTARLERLGALQQWRKELCRGDASQRAQSPSTWRYDALWRAACYEAAALENERMNLHPAAADSMRRAIETMKAA